MIDKKIRPLPKKLSEAQKIVLANYPNARCGIAKALKDAMKEFKDTAVLGSFGKNSKWVIYTEPESEYIGVLTNVMGVSSTTQDKAWEDAAAVMGKFMLWKLER